MCLSKYNTDYVEDRIEEIEKVRGSNSSGRCVHRPYVERATNNNKIGEGIHSATRRCLVALLGSFEVKSSSESTSSCAVKHRLRQTKLTAFVSSVSRVDRKRGLQEYMRVWRRNSAKRPLLQQELLVWLCLGAEDGPKTRVLTVVSLSRGEQWHTISFTERQTGKATPLMMGFPFLPLFLKMAAAFCSMRSSANLHSSEIFAPGTIYATRRRENG